MATTQVSLKGDFDRSEVVINTKLTANCDVIAEGNVAIGENVTIRDSEAQRSAHVEGVNAINSDSYSFVWNGNPDIAVDSKGNGSFHINATNDIDGVYINNKTVRDHIKEISPDIRPLKNQFTGENEFSNTVLIKNNISSTQINGGSVVINSTPSNGGGLKFKFGDNSAVSASITEEANGVLKLAANNEVRAPMPEVTENVDSEQVATVGFVNRRVSQGVSDPDLDNESLTFATTSFTHKLIRQYLDLIFSSTDAEGNRHSVIKEFDIQNAKTLLLGLPDYNNSASFLDKFVEGYQFEHDGYIFITMAGTEDYPAVVEIDNVRVAFNEDNESTYFFPVTKGSIVTYFRRGLPDNNGVSGITYLPIKDTSALSAPQYELFDMKFLDYQTNSSEWLRQDGWNWISVNRAPQAYEHLYQEAQEGTPLTDTYTLTNGNTLTISYVRADDGHKIIQTDNDAGLTGLKVLFDDIGTAWYYVIDEKNQRFQLPHTVSVPTTIDSTINYPTPGVNYQGAVPNITGDFVVDDSVGVFDGTGAFYAKSSPGYDASSTTSGNSRRMVLDAGRCSKVYGNTINGKTYNAVIPAGPKCYLYFYVGGNIDVDEYTVYFNYAIDDVVVSESWYPDYIGYNSIEKVRNGRYVTIPAVNTIDKCQFEGWYQTVPVESGRLAINSLVRIVNDPTVFVARFYRRYVVKFTYTWDNETKTLATYYIVNNKCYDSIGNQLSGIIYPTIPTIDGYVGSWDTSNLPTGWPSLSSIKEDITINAIYSAIEDELANIPDDDNVQGYRETVDGEELYINLSPEEIDKLVFLDMGISNEGELIVLDISDYTGNDGDVIPEYSEIENAVIADISSPYMFDEA